MIREYFCTQCGLYFWLDYEKERTCQNPECKNHSLEDTRDREPVYACDSTVWFYFSRDNQDAIREMCWTSSDYIPEHLLSVYEKMGVTIRSGASNA